MRYRLSIPATVFLIALTILLITAFQAYWLSNNYREEKRLFTVRTNILFRETIFRLQAVKLNLDSNISLRIQDRAGMTGISNVLQEGMRDAVVPDNRVRGLKRTMVVALNTTSVPANDTSVNVGYHVARALPAVPTAGVFQFLAGVDSLRDSITVKEVVDRYQQAIDREKINVSFEVSTTPFDTS